MSERRGDGIRALGVQGVGIGEVEAADCEGEGLRGDGEDGVAVLQVFADAAALGVDGFFLDRPFFSDVGEFGAGFAHAGVAEFALCEVGGHDVVPALEG